MARSDQPWPKMARADQPWSETARATATSHKRGDHARPLAVCDLSPGRELRSLRDANRIPQGTRSLCGEIPGGSGVGAQPRYPPRMKRASRVCSGAWASFARFAREFALFPEREDQTANFGSKCTLRALPRAPRSLASLARMNDNTLLNLIFLKN